MIADMAPGAIDVAFPVGGGLYYSEENGIYLSNPIASSSTDIVFKGTFDEDTVSRFAVNENNRMQFYFIKKHFPDAEISCCPASVLFFCFFCFSLIRFRIGHGFVVPSGLMRVYMLMA